MSRYNTLTPEGTRDLLFEACAVRKDVERTLGKLFAGRGFTEVVTPTIEFLDVFDLKGYKFPPEQMYKFSDSKGRMIVLRPDSTVPIARLVSTRLKTHAMPLRLYYNQPVFVQNRLLSGHSDEVVQTGIEIIGSGTKKADLEVIATAVEALDLCKTNDFRLEIGHVGIFNTLVKGLGVDEDMAERIRRLIELKNYPALNDLLDSIDNEKAQALKQLPRLFGGEEVFDRANVLFPNSGIEGILDYLKEIYSALSAFSLNDQITLDLGMVNRAEYYTGLVFRGYIEGFGDEVLSGGRYDTLLSEFGVPYEAIGFGINVDAVTTALLKNSAARFKITPPSVLVHAKDGFEMKALLYARSLGRENVICENSVCDTREAAIEYAKQKGIKQVHVIGETTEIISA